MTIQDLKARAYDLIAMSEQAQAELRKVNEEIARLSVEESKPTEEPKAGEVEETSDAESIK